MLFPAHLAAVYVLARRWNRPLGWLIVGAALPDVVDKPLAVLGVVDLFHSVGHSAVVLLAVGAAWTVVRARATTNVSDAAAVAVWLGWVSHLALDAVHVVVNGRPSSALSLLWPLAVPPTPLGLGPIAFLFVYRGTPSFYLEIVVWVGAVWTAVRSPPDDG